MNITKHPIAVTIYKTGEMIYFSQLDLVRIFERALRRSNLPLYFSQGFTPRVKISFLNGLKLGVAGEIKAVFYFSQKVPADLFLEKISCQLPSGLEITSISETK